MILNRDVYERTNDEIGKLASLQFYYEHDVKTFLTSRFLINFSEAMIGDTNLFINQDYFLTGSDDESTQQDLHDETIIAEAEIMIAESEARGKGFGKEALLLMLKYGTELGIQEFVSKIGFDNTASQNLFSKLKFVEQSRSDVFQEIAYKRTANEDWVQWLDNEITNYKIEDYLR